MILGLNSSEKEFKTAMETAGADMTYVNRWLKLYQKTRKNSENVIKRYYGVKTALSTLSDELRELEQLVIGYQRLTGSDKSRFNELIKSIKSKKGMFDDEFLISSEDADFHSTMQSVMKLGGVYVNTGENGIILQSEIENLIHLTEEGLKREKPDLFALAFFYLEHTNKELEEMNFSQKAKHIHKIYFVEFKSKILKQIEACVKQAEAINDKYEGCTERYTKKILLEIRPLLVGVERHYEPEQTAEYILNDMCRLFKE